LQGCKFEKKKNGMLARGERIKKKDSRQERKKNIYCTLGFKRGLFGAHE
jgi:hypothetical protein